MQLAESFIVVFYVGGLLQGCFCLDVCSDLVDPYVSGIDLGTTELTIHDANIPLSLRFAAIGDWGLDTNRHDTYKDWNETLNEIMAKSLGNYISSINNHSICNNNSNDNNNNSNNISFVINVGDNFYQNGISSLNNSRWNTTFEYLFNETSLYDKYFYTVLGNHDWAQNTIDFQTYPNNSNKWDLGTRNQIEYTNYKHNIYKRWCLPAYYYTFSYSVTKIDNTTNKNNQKSKNIKNDENSKNGKNPKTNKKSKNSNKNEDDDADSTLNVRFIALDTDILISKNNGGCCNITYDNNNWNRNVDSDSIYQCFGKIPTCTQQLSWLNELLNNIKNESNNNSPDWIIVYFHHFFASVGAHGMNGGYPNMANIANILFENNVPLTIAGHEHITQSFRGAPKSSSHNTNNSQQMENEMLHIVTGSFGKTDGQVIGNQSTINEIFNDNPQSNVNWQLEYAQKQAAFGDIIITKDNINVKFIGKNQQILYQANVHD